MSAGGAVAMSAGGAVAMKRAFAMSARRALVGALAGLALIAASCGEDAAARADPGLDADLFVSNGSFVRGPFPAPASTLAVRALYVASPRLRFDDPEVGLSGTLDAGSHAVLVGLEGDVGYWIVPARPPESESPTAPSFAASFALGGRRRGSAALRAAAVDDQSRAGPLATLPLELVDPAAEPPTAALVFELRWTPTADLDLQVVEPNGAVLFQGSPRSALGGRLLSDAGADCSATTRRELASWETAPAGRFAALVDAFDLCGAARVEWQLQVKRDGLLVAETRGSLGAESIRSARQRGSGLRALELEVR